MPETTTEEFVVYHKVSDIDRCLFIKRHKDLTKSDIGHFKGTRKECHLYVREHQGDAKTPSLLKPVILPPDIPVRYGYGGAV